MKKRFKNACSLLLGVSVLMLSACSTNVRVGHANSDTGNLYADIVIPLVIDLVTMDEDDRKFEAEKAEAEQARTIRRMGNELEEAPSN